MKTNLALPEVNRLVADANAARRRGEAPNEAERTLEATFGTHQRLAVYGTLAPGQPNHHVVAPLGGEWTDGVVEGDLHPVGWGATLGFPAFRSRPGGPTVRVLVLRSPLLPEAWPEIDRFEGAEYRRILVPVFRFEGKELSTVANLYGAAEEMPIDDRDP